MRTTAPSLVRHIAVIALGLFAIAVVGFTTTDRAEAADLARDQSFELYTTVNPLEFWPNEHGETVLVGWLASVGIQLPAPGPSDANVTWEDHFMVGGSTGPVEVNIGADGYATTCIAAGELLKIFPECVPAASTETLESWPQRVTVEVPGYEAQSAELFYMG